MELDSLYVKSAVANDGPRMKRIRPAPMGRAFRYVRRIAHIEIVLAERGKARSGDRGWRGKAAAAPAKTRRAGAGGKESEEEEKESRGEIDSRTADESFVAHRFGLGAHGTKSSSLWISPRLHQAVEVALVCREGLRQAVARRRQAEGELKDKLKSAGVSSIEIERPGNKLRIIIKTARPGIIIGRKGAEIDKLKRELQKRTSREVHLVDIQEVHKPELDAQLVSESIALQLEKRVGFRRAMRKSVDSALRFGCKGIKVRVSGRLNGNEIARSEWYLQGRLPLHTLRADIDYGFTEARTTYGVIGVKCWVYKGEILPQKKREASGSSRAHSKDARK